MAFFSDRISSPLNWLALQNAPGGLCIEEPPKLVPAPTANRAGAIFYHFSIAVRPYFGDRIPGRNEAAGISVCSNLKPIHLRS